MNSPTLETLWHVTVLSNFVRGYDKYARIYSKQRIAESTFPERCFLLQESEIEIGIRKAGGPVLEVACGTGRITLPIARDGAEVTGLDVSRPMLELARRKSATEGRRIEWIEQDCRAMNFTRRFALIFSATNAMQHLPDSESASAFLQGTRRALAPGGRLILDVFNPAPAKLARTAASRYLHKTIASPDGADIRVEAASEYLAETQILRFELFYLRGGELLRTKRVHLRCFFPGELLALCRFNGLEVTERFGSYDEEPFTGVSPKQILICQDAAKA